jgi:hypothetical protein
LNGKLAAGSLLALTLGVVIGIPFLFQNISLGEPPRVYAEVAYANFQFQNPNSNVTGMQRETWVSYVFVLNVTNLSNQLVIVNGFEALAAERMTFFSMTENDGSTYFTEPLKVEWNETTQVRYNATGFGSQNPVGRSAGFPLGNEYYWPAGESRLIALTGFVAVPGATLDEFTGGKIFVFSHVDGKVYASRQSVSGAYVIKGIRLQVIQNSNFVFNNLLGPNQHLRITGDGAGVTIVSES